MRLKNTSLASNHESATIPSRDISRIRRRVTCNSIANEASDAVFMRQAIEQARKAALVGEVPVGAIIVQDGVVISAAHNETVLRKSPLAHAEVICMERAAQALGAWRLLDCTMFVTVEPCPMCAGAILTGRLRRLVYGARQPRIGADGSWISMFHGSRGMDLESMACSGSQPLEGKVNEPILPLGPHPFHPGICISRGILQIECAELLQAFFRQRRLFARPSSDVTDRD